MADAPSVAGNEGVDRIVAVLSKLDTDAERLLVLDFVEGRAGEGGALIVDDLRARFSSPWALLLAVHAVSQAASDLGIVFEAGRDGKSVATLENVRDEDAQVAAHLMENVLQGKTPRIVEDIVWVGIPETVPAARSPGPCALVPAAPSLDVAMARNRAARVPVLKRIAGLAAVALRVAAARSEICPWPLLARREYLRRAEAKVSYLLPFVVGVQIAGARLVSSQARWAMTAATGRTVWPRCFRVPIAVRQSLCADLGWTCLWVTARVAAVMLFVRCRADPAAFQHARLARETELLAPGGWMWCTQRLMDNLHIEHPVLPVAREARKAVLRRFKQRTVLPAVLRASRGGLWRQPPLPWAWLAARADQDFPQAAFELWWQIRALKSSHPKQRCPWCPGSDVTLDHLRLSCGKFAECCWIRGVRPEEAFGYPVNESVFRACLLASAALADAVRAANADDSSTVPSTSRADSSNSGSECDSAELSA